MDCGINKILWELRGSPVMTIWRGVGMPHHAKHHGDLTVFVWSVSLV